MTLDEYLSTAKDENGKALYSDAAFGALCGLSQSQVSRLRSGQFNPSFGAIDAIRRVTNGKVSPNDWFVEAVQ